MVRARLAGIAAVFVILAPAAGRAGDPAAPSEPEVKLVSPGRPPLRPLRFRLQAGQRGSGTMSMTFAFAMSMGGQEMPSAPAPETRCRLDYHVTAVSPAGDARYEFEIGYFEAVAQPAVPPAVLEATRTALARLKGLRGHVVVSERGITREADVEIPADAPPPVRAMADSLRQSIRQMSAPLPEQPVGVGARWETTYRMTMNGIALEQVARNELTSLEGDRGRLAIAVTQTAPPQQLRNPDMPSGARADLVSLASSGEGAAEFDLTRLLPVSGSMAMKLRMKTRIQIGEQPAQDMDTRMDMSMTVTGR